MTLFFFLLNHQITTIHHSFQHSFHLMFIQHVQVQQHTTPIYHEHFDSMLIYQPSYESKINEVNFDFELKNKQPNVNLDAFYSAEVVSKLRQKEQTQSFINKPCSLFVTDRSLVVFDRATQVALHAKRKDCNGTF